MGKKKAKKLVFGAKKPVTTRTVEDYLADMPAYQAYRKFTQISMVCCLLCISGSVLLRINAEGFDEIVLFLNILAYVLVGSLLFIWLSQLRPMRKRAVKAAKEFNAALEPEVKKQSDSLMLADGIVDATADGVTTTPVQSQKPAKRSLIDKITKSAENGPAKDSLPRDPLYLRYRLIWRALLAAAAALIIIASVILRVFEGDPGLALTVQIAAIIPVAAAIYIYRIHLRPLKQKWTSAKKD